MLIELKSLYFYKEEHILLTPKIVVTIKNAKWYGHDKSYKADQSKEKCFITVKDFLNLKDSILKEKVWYTNIFSYTEEEIYKTISRNSLY